MKYLLILLFTFNANAFCDRSTEVGVNACTLDEVFTEIASRLMPLEPLNFADPVTPPVSMYDRLLNNPKPTLAQFDADLVLWKSERVAEIQAAAALKAAHDAFDLKFDALNKLRLRASLCSLDKPNMAVVARDLKLAMDETAYTCLKSKDAQVQARLDEEALQQAIIVKKKRMAQGQDIIAEFTIRNEAKSLSQSQKLTLFTRLAPIKSCLEVGDLLCAKALIAAEVADAIVTQADKDVLSARIDAKLAQ